MSAASHTSTYGTPVWLWPNLLGLDAPLVAVSWQWLFAKVFDVDLPSALHLILGLSVWCIYLADRLLDSIRLKNISAGTSRLRFSRQHFSKLLALLVLSALANLYLIVRFVPRPLVVAGMATACLLGIYYAYRIFFSQSIIPREILCGSLFAFGSVLAPLTLGTHGFSFLLAVSLLALVCSISCILISIWENEEDLASGEWSIATGRSKIIPQLPKILFLLVLSSACLAFYGAWQVCVAIGLSAAALGIIHWQEKRLDRVSLRVLADAVLLTPLLFLAC